MQKNTADDPAGDRAFRDVSGHAADRLIIAKNLVIVFLGARSRFPGLRSGLLKFGVRDVRGQIAHNESASPFTNPSWRRPLEIGEFPELPRGRYVGIVNPIPMIHQATIFSASHRCPHRPLRSVQVRDDRQGAHSERGSL
jgi:hypothetical protein